MKADIASSVRNNNNHNVQKKMNLNSRQIECLQTCMDSCQNVAYPSLGLVEEVGEYVEKLLPLVEWSDDFAERDRLCMLLKGIVHNAACIAAINKQVRHRSMPVPFRLKSSLGNGDPKLYAERIESLRQELGDVSWMLNVADFHVANAFDLDRSPEYETPGHDVDGGATRRKPVVLAPTAESLAALNRDKLQARRQQGTIDAKGDSVRTSL